MLCPRRSENGDWQNSIFKTPSLDEWREDSRGWRTCSYCGSLHPDDLFDAIDANCRLTPTDKSYKIYVDLPDVSACKHYFQHLNTEEKKEFVELMNLGRMNLASPGHFYVMPFFAVR